MYPTLSIDAAVLQIGCTLYTPPVLDGVLSYPTAKVAFVSMVAKLSYIIVLLPHSEFRLSALSVTRRRRMTRCHSWNVGAGVGRHPVGKTDHTGSVAGYS